MVYFCSKSVVSVASLVDDEKMRKELELSDYVRTEALNRLCSMPSYSCKSLKWKNRYYDYFKRQVLRELKTA